MAATAVAKVAEVREITRYDCQVWLVELGTCYNITGSLEINTWVLTELQLQGGPKKCPIRTLGSNLFLKVECTFPYAL